MVKYGIDRIEEYAYLFRGRHLGMVSAAGATGADLRPAYIVFHEKFPLRCLFSPEHGLNGQFGNWEQVVEAPTDPQTGAAIVSLFGHGSAHPIPKHWMQQLDAIVYDIQDLGTRFYTYISTMIQVMEDCAAAGKELIILDRPAVLGGEILEGTLLEDRYRSFVGPHPLPIRYGLTVGELAQMVNGERKLGCQLQVIPCEGWLRSQMFPDYGNHWVKPSGAIRDFETALLYPGMCLFEATTLSEGRGTDVPFRVVGAPFVDGQTFARDMNRMGLPGVVFQSAVFTPKTSKYLGQRCEGVSIQVTDAGAYRSVLTAVSLLYKLLERYPDSIGFPQSRWSSLPHIRYLAGCDSLDHERPALDRLMVRWEADCEVFRSRKSKYHIYP